MKTEPCEWWRSKRNRPETGCRQLFKRSTSSTDNLSFSWSALTYSSIISVFFHKTSASTFNSQMSGQPIRNCSSSSSLILNVWFVKSSNGRKSLKNVFRSSGDKVSMSSIKFFSVITSSLFFSKRIVAFFKRLAKFFKTFFVFQNCSKKIKIIFELSLSIF